MLNSRAWLLVRTNLAIELDRAKDLCVQQTEPVAIYRAQGAAKALISAIGMGEELRRRAVERRAK